LIADNEPAKRAEQYQQLITRDFGHDLTYGAGLAQRFFGRYIFLSSVPSKMVQLMQRSPRFCEIMQDLFAGTQPYVELKTRLLRNLNGTLREIITSFFLRKLILGYKV
jgi:hypothetical protein